MPMSVKKGEELKIAIRKTLTKPREHALFKQIGIEEIIERTGDAEYEDDGSA
jgi:hypothetical protein